jgi:hypothetical protein
MNIITITKRPITPTGWFCLVAWFPPATYEGNEFCIKMCIYIYCYRLFITTAAIFSATYTLQQLDRSLRSKQKNEKTSYRIRLVTSVSLL